MTTGDTDRIDRTIEVNAPPEKVWRALTGTKDLSTWFRVGRRRDRQALMSG